MKLRDVGLHLAPRYSITRFVYYLSFVLVMQATKKSSTDTSGDGKKKVREGSLNTLPYKDRQCLLHCFFDR
jgi:hypothetical protein